MKSTRIGYSTYNAYIIYLTAQGQTDIFRKLTLGGRRFEI